MSNSMSRVRLKKRAMSDRDLSIQQKLFVEHLLSTTNFNAAAAAEKAGYACPSVAASKLIKNPIINSIIGKSIDERIERTKLRAERVLLELARIAFSDIRKLFSSDGTLLNIVDLPEDVAASIQSVEVESRSEPGEEKGSRITVTTAKIRFWNKLNALELLSKHLGLLDTKGNSTGVANESVLSELLQRAEDNNTTIVDSDLIGRLADESKPLENAQPIKRTHDGNLPKAPRLE